MLFSINCPNFIVFLPLLLEIYSNMCTATVCFTSCNVLNFEINGRFLMTNKDFLQNIKIHVFDTAAFWGFTKREFAAKEGQSTQTKYLYLT